jgi:AcrR family transcriptional regulator
VDLRERRRAATREQIIEAVHQVLTEEHPATLSMPQVAKRAGTSLRTLYRYFPTKEALVDAASQTFTVPATAVGGRVGMGNLDEYLRASWNGFSRSVAAVRAQHLTPAGRALRERRLPSSRVAVRTVLVDDGVDLPDDELDLLVDLVVALMSSAMYLEMVDRFGHSEEDAARVTSWAIAAIVEHAKHEGAIER